MWDIPWSFNRYIRCIFKSFFFSLAVSSASSRNSCIEETLPSFSRWALIQMSSFFGSLNFESHLQRQCAWTSQVSLQGASSSLQRTILHVQKDMSKSLSSLGSNSSLVAFRALPRAISENVAQAQLSLCSIAFWPQTTGSFNSLLELDHRAAISIATSEKN